MTNQFILSEKIFNREKLIAIIALFIATIAISFATIFVKWSEVELSANATVFNRLWIATVIFAFWNSFNFVYLKLSNSQHNQESFSDNPYSKNVILLLLALGAVYHRANAYSLSYFQELLESTGFSLKTHDLGFVGVMLEGTKK